MKFTIPNDAPIHYIWFGQIPNNIANNILKTAYMHQGQRKVKLWVSKADHVRNISEIEKSQHLEIQKCPNISIQTIEENLTQTDLRIVHAIFSNQNILHNDKLKSASDYTRIAVLAQEGGIYFDGDVTSQSLICNLDCKYEKPKLYHVLTSQ